MAFSKSLCKGQVPMSCQMCEESNEIKWKCLQCGFLLCTKCRRLHKKVKSTDQHNIIDIRDIALHQQQASNIPCEIHSGQNSCLFCQTCNEVVCPLCIAKSHNKHDMIELADGFRITVNTLKTFNSELNVKLTNSVKGISKLSSLVSSEDVKYEREKQNILSRDKVLKYEVEMHTQKLLKELDLRRDHLKISVHDADNKSQKINKDLVFRRDSLTKALASVNTLDVFYAYKQETAARKQTIEPVNARFKRLPQYEPGKLQIHETLHGKFITSDDEYSLEQYETKVIKQYKTGLVLIEFLNCCDDGILWIGCNEDNIIQKIHFSKGLINIIHQKQVYFVGMALLPSGDILISTAETNLKILSHTTGKITHSKYSVAPLITGAVYVTGDNKIIVRTRKEGSVFPVKGIRQVVVMDTEGRIEKVYGLDDNGKPIFSAPQRITADTDNNIYVLDSLNKDKSGRIVALNTNKGVKWVYSGNPDINKGEQTFRPNDLVCTKLNHVITTDMDSAMIHVLNSSGQCIYYLNTISQLSIHRPYSLVIDNSGTLYIGCSTCQRDSIDAKIYTVQFSGF